MDRSKIEKLALEGCQRVFETQKAETSGAEKTGSSQWRKMLECILALDSRDTNQ